MKTEPFVSTILVNFNGKRYTQACIESLRKMNYKNYEIIVVDNGSTDGSKELFSNMPDIKFIDAKANVGFAKANNLGVKNANPNAKYVVLLNNDTFVEKNWLKEAIAPFEKDPNLGAGMAKIYNKYEKSDYRFEGYGTMTILGFFSHAGKKNVEIKDHHLPELFFASGCTLIFPKKLSNQPFDDDHFIYAEDTYFCWLLRLQGYTIRMIPKSIVYHEGGAVTKDFRQMGKFFTYLGERNRIMNMFIFYKPLSLLKLAPLAIFTLIFNNVYDIKNIPTRMKSYGWILAHPLRIAKKRKFAQSKRKVSDKEIFKYMSYKLFEEESLTSPSFRKILKACNTFSKNYCNAVGIKTIESYDHQW